MVSQELMNRQKDTRKEIDSLSYFIYRLLFVKDFVPMAQESQILNVVKKYLNIKDTRDQFVNT